MSDDLVKRLRMVTGFIRFETGDSACLSEEAADRIEELERKLAKAVLALDEAIYLLDPEIDGIAHRDEDIVKGTRLYPIVTTLAELKGEDRG